MIGGRGRFECILNPVSEFLHNFGALISRQVKIFALLCKWQVLNAISILVFNLCLHQTPHFWEVFLAQVLTVRVTSTHFRVQVRLFLWKEHKNELHLLA